ncbi:sulfur carrier protein ThiS [Vreelandella jeotgali]|uniref:sulfur carrier protein ThiS n=1 Tax=Vreelandella jeotgali TaxID=553386 RepID=UPI00034D132F|nr:sulfur carrier protein ThiS [Halomonas jeotgali]
MTAMTATTEAAIQLNGESRALAPDTSAADLVEQLGLGGQRIAVEINEEIVPRSRLAETPLADGDQVEIVHAIGGG